ncbi:unnamed protein product [Rotaria sordida]|uniref:Uncharacterized protein n=2 Tax=Rotaria sordida TaxID=392033 RepID=A0A814J6P5_9BILA|nr:unnamed protein product [Rotaria sordida]CAF3736179.1 unnamed protein product [Rotaria sordida]
MDSSGSSSVLFNHPFDVTMDFMGNVYIADGDNFRIQFFRAGSLNGLAKEHIEYLMTKLRINAFENLVLNEIQHIVDVMCEPNVEENENLIYNNIMKRT